MTPKELVEGLAHGDDFLDLGLTVVDGPHVVSDQKVVVYVAPVEGSPRLRLEVTQ
jgi:hypothetical protein